MPLDIFQLCFGKEAVGSLFTDEVKDHFHTPSRIQLLLPSAAVPRLLPLTSRGTSSLRDFYLQIKIVVPP